MPIKISRSSDRTYQSSLLVDIIEHVDDLPEELVSDRLYHVLRDPDILRGSEPVHPDALSLLEKHRDLVDPILSRLPEEAGQEWRDLLSPVDPTVGELDPESDSISFLLGAGASSPFRLGVRDKGVKRKTCTFVHLSRMLSSTPLVRLESTDAQEAVHRDADGG